MEILHNLILKVYVKIKYIKKKPWTEVYSVEGRSGQVYVRILKI